MSKKSRILRSLSNPLNDPNYICRVTTVTTKTVFDETLGKKVVVPIRPVDRHTTPVGKLPDGSLKQMNRSSPHDGVSPRKNPRIVNNAPKYKNKIKSNGQVVRIRIRPVVKTILTKEAVALLRIGDSKSILNDAGRISICYKKRIICETRQLEDKNFGFQPVMKQKKEHNRL